MICQASQTVTASGTSTSFRLHRDTTYVEYQLNVTAAATAAGDLLDVFIQSSTDGGATWDDAARFTQVLGNGGAKRFLARCAVQYTPTAGQAAAQDGAMAAGAVQGPKSRFQRVKWVVTSASAPSFTFSVTASARKAL